MTRADFLEIVANGIVKYEGNVNSWIRSPDHNLSEAVGGHPNSFHISGEAVDAWFREREDAELFKRYCERHGLGTKWNGQKTVHVQKLRPE